MGECLPGMVNRVGVWWVMGSLGQSKAVARIGSRSRRWKAVGVVIIFSVRSGEHLSSGNGGI